MRWFYTVLALLAAIPFSALARDTPSGLPVPRYAELKHSRTHCRSGPSFDHPARITFVRAAIPVQITAETRDHWRRIRDIDGVECWVHKATLAAPSHVIVQAPAELRARPDVTAPILARLSPGVLAEARAQRREWRRLSADGVSGWTRDAQLWGAD